jgi:organic radical activating enzyme
MPQFRIVVTEKCEASCEYCFNKKLRKNTDIDEKKLFEFFERNKNDLSDYQIKLMGGEPFLHPNFSWIFKELSKYFKSVSIFTNGININEKASSLSEPLNHSWVTINSLTFNIQKNIDKLKKFYFKYRPKYVTLHMVISSNTNKDKFLKDVQLLNKYFFQENVAIKLSPDTMVNIFDEKIKEIYKSTWFDFLDELSKINSLYITADHNFPTCLFDVDEILKFKQAGLRINNNCKCCVNLIKTNLDLFYCNQTNIKICNLFNGEVPIGMDTIHENMINGIRKKKEAIKKHAHCYNCKVIDFCLCGCYFNTLIRDEHSIC